MVSIVEIQVLSVRNLRHISPGKSGFLGQAGDRWQLALVPVLSIHDFPSSFDVKLEEEFPVIVKRMFYR